MQEVDVVRTCPADRDHVRLRDGHTAAQAEASPCPARPPRESAEPADCRRSDLLVQEHRAVPERNRRDEIRDQHRIQAPAPAMRAEVQEIGNRQAERSQRGRPSRSPSSSARAREAALIPNGSGRDRVCDRQRPERGSDRRRRSQARACIERRGGVARGSEQDGEAQASQSPCGCAPIRKTTPRKPTTTPIASGTADAVAPAEAKGEQRGEERCRGLEDGSQAGVEPFLTPREQPEGNRRVEQRENDKRPREAAQLGEEPPPPGS